MYKFRVVVSIGFLKNRAKVQKRVQKAKFHKNKIGVMAEKRTNSPVFTLHPMHTCSTWVT